MSKNGFSADKAAFFVFDKREDKAALRRLGMVYVAGRLILFVIVMSITAPFLVGTLPELLDLDPDSTQFAMEIQSFANVFQTIGLVAGVIFLPLFISIYTALLRWMIHGQSGSKRIGLRFGEQELHVLVVFIAVTVLLVFGMIFSIIPLAIIMVVAATLLKAAGSAMVALATIPFGIIWLGVVIWFAVRLSPATALTVKRGKIQIFETFAVSKGHFWGLFLAYVLQFFVIIAASIAIVFIALLVSLPFLGIGLAMFGWSEPDMANVNAYIALAAVPVLIISITGFILEYLRYAMGAGVGACLVVAEGVPAVSIKDEASKIT